MKKVVNGRMFNTETAKKLGEATNGRYGTFEYWEEALYLTKSGAYFLYGYGGAYSKYARPASNGNWSDGYAIQEMSPAAAREWAEKNLSGDDYEEIFGETEEAGDSSREPLNTTVSLSCKRLLNKLKQETGKSIGQLIEEKFMS